MTFLFLDKVAEIVGASADLVSAARERIFKQPVRHEGLRRLPRDEVRAHVAGVVVQIANAKLRQPLMDAVTAHALEAREMHEMIEGPCSDEEMRDVVIAAFAGNDVGIDMSAFPVGEASPEAVADQVLTVPAGAETILAHLCVENPQLDAIVDEILTPVADTTPWSVERLAGTIVGYKRTAHAEEIARSLFSDEPELRVTGFELLGHENASLEEWLAERAIFSSPESDEADVAEVLRLVGQSSAYTHLDLTPHETETREVVDADGATLYVPSVAAHEASAKRTAERAAAPIAAEPSDITRAVTAALSALYELTKETDTHIAEVLGVSKATVNQARKGVTPWAPNAEQFVALQNLADKYLRGLEHAVGQLALADTANG